MLNITTLGLNSGRRQQLQELMKHLIGKNDMIIEQSKEYNVRKCSV